jgi:hypothetical protein
MPIRTCRENALFSEKVEQYRERYPRIDDVVDAACWLLAREPRAGQQLPDDPEYFILQTVSVGSTPSFWILYHFDADYIDLLAIGAAQ